MTLAEFTQIEKFDDAFKCTCRHLNLDAKNYADLKADPKKYNLMEDAQFMKFFVKNRLESGELEGIIVFIVVSIPGRIQIKHKHLDKLEIDFISEAIKGEKWM